ncbi:MAG: hypothetical protein ACXWUG_27820 [Polyangiales bacterium]
MQKWNETPIVDFVGTRSEIPPASQVRSTLVAASIQALRHRGLLDRYRESLTTEWADRLCNAPAGTWLPIEWAEQHYGACDRLGIEDDAILEMGNAVATLTQKTVFSLAARLAKEAGASPLTVLAQSQRLWSRLFVGGCVAAFQTGPKDARYETVGISLARHRYWRVGYRGIMYAITAPFSRSIIVRELPQRVGQTFVTMKLAWA